MIFLFGRHLALTTGGWERDVLDEMQFTWGEGKPWQITSKHINLITNYFQM